jgi:hypothetical protein
VGDMASILSFDGEEVEEFILAYAMKCTREMSKLSMC